LRSKVIEARAVDVQVQVVSGSVAFVLVGLPDKAVAESRERVRAALTASGLAMPAKRVVVNLAPADCPRRAAISICRSRSASWPPSARSRRCARRFHRAGRTGARWGDLPRGRGVARRSGGQRARSWADLPQGLWFGGGLGRGRYRGARPASLIQLANHFKGTQVLARPEPVIRSGDLMLPDLKDVKGQETAKRALEIVAAGGHNLLMSGPPGAGKSMLAQRLPSILPPLGPRELLEVSMVHSVAGLLTDGALTNRGPSARRIIRPRLRR
jgi:magnesium chelatase family protein